jgi:hypothetical protein
MRTIRRAVAVAAAVVAGPLAAGQVVVDDFSDNNDNGWDRSTLLQNPAHGANWDAATGAYRLFSTTQVPSNQTSGIYAIKLDMNGADFANGTYRVKVRAGNETTRIDLLARASFFPGSPSSLNGYQATILFEEGLFLSGSLFGVSSNFQYRALDFMFEQDYAPRPNRDYWVDFRVDDRLISVSIWQVGQQPPDAPQMQFIEPPAGPQFTQGVFGVAAYHEEGAGFTTIDATFDDITWTPTPVCDSIDFNGDGVFPDLNDIVDFFFVFGGGNCPTPSCNDIDFNGDGVFPDLADVIKFLDVYGGGTC